MIHSLENYDRKFRKLNKYEVKQLTMENMEEPHQIGLIKSHLVDYPKWVTSA